MCRFLKMQSLHNITKYLRMHLLLSIINKRLEGPVDESHMARPQLNFKKMSGHLCSMNKKIHLVTIKYIFTVCDDSGCCQHAANTMG